MQLIRLATLGLLLSPVVAAAQTVTIDQAACRYVTRHVPAADVEYQPGVDVHGKKVAPADLGGGSQIQFPTRFSTLISVDLAKKLNLPPGGETKAYVGELTYDRGQLFFNGQPIGDALEQDFAVLCRNWRAGDGKPPAAR